MKKVLAILLVLVVAMTGVMAEATTVTLKSTITEGIYFGVAASTKASDINAAITSTGSYTGIWGSDSVTIEDAFSGTKTVYFGYVANRAERGGAEVSVVATPFVKYVDGAAVTSPASIQQVGYKITGESTYNSSSSTTSASVVETEVVPEANSVTSQKVTVVFPAFSQSGSHGQEVSLSFTADEDDYKIAEAGDYLATVTFNITNY